MGTLYIAGLGPGDAGHLTQEVCRLLQSSLPIYLRTAIHPTVDYLVAEGISFTSFDYLYEEKDEFSDIYTTIVSSLVDLAKEEDILYLVPGSPLVAERTVRLLQEAEKNGEISLRILPGMSFLEILYTRLGIDPIEGIYIGDAQEDKANLPQGTQTIILTQLYNPHIASEVKLSLMDVYEDDQPVTVVHHLSLPDEKIITLPLYEIDRLPYIDHLSSLVIGKSPTKRNAAKELSELQHIMATLRGEGGCPWDKAQTHDSLQRYLLEETYEVLDALVKKDIANLCEELGDLLFQIIFHAQVAEEEGEFTLCDIIKGLNEKMIRRHPHVFGDIRVDSPEEVNGLWEQIKEQESENLQQNNFERIPTALPALLRAQKIQEKAAKLGFDWVSPQGAWEKFAEEIAEFKEAILKNSKKDMEEEAGDVLFSLLNVIRWYKIVGESALTVTNHKFQRRFAFVADKVAASEKTWQDFSLEELDVFWDEAKALEREGAAEK